MASTESNNIPPGFKKGDNNKKWKKKYSFWQRLTTLEKAKQGPALVLSLDEESQDAILDLDEEVINGENGVDAIFKVLDELYLEDKAQTAIVNEQLPSPPTHLPTQPQPPEPPPDPPPNNYPSLSVPSHTLSFPTKFTPQEEIDKVNSKRVAREDDEDDTSKLGLASNKHNSADEIIGDNKHAPAKENFGCESQYSKRDAIACKICFEEFSLTDRRPRSFSCGHCFCTPCCAKLLSLSEVVQCPTCREKHDKNVEHVHEIPIAFQIEEILETFGAQLCDEPLDASAKMTGVLPSSDGVSPTAVTAPVMPAAPLSPTPPTPTPVEATPPTPPTPEKEEISWGTTAGGENWDASTEAAPVSWAESTPTALDTPDPDPPLPETPEVHPQPVSMPQEPKTFANLFKNTSGYSASPVMPPAPTPAAAPAPVSQPPVAAAPAAAIPQQPSQQASNTADYNEDMSWGANDGWTETSQRSGQGFGQRQGRNERGRGGPPRDRPYRPASEENADFDSFGEDRRRPPNAPDSQQIFVGNLPHATTEEELKTEFSRFGKIADVRINTAKGKTGPKGQGHQVPNFGFVTFEDENAVNKVLSNRPIHLNGDHRLNVEEKKARQRMDGGMGRQGSGRGMGGERGGMRQGMGGERGGMRGGRGDRGGFNRDNIRGGPDRGRGTFQRR